MSDFDLVCLGLWLTAEVLSKTPLKSNTPVELIINVIKFLARERLE